MGGGGGGGRRGEGEASSYVSVYKCNCVVTTYNMTWGWLDVSFM